MSDESTNTFNFETALAELNQLVTEMERGDISLEDSLKKFERGIKLTRQCQQALTQAEQQVKILLEQNGQTELSHFDPPTGEN